MPLSRKNPVTPRSTWSLLACNCGACAAIFLLLELWRPCYFLTDDNLSGTFPVLTEMGRRLKSGQSPFISDYLFGGHYNWLRDAGAANWHPLCLAPTLLCDTFARFWIIDVIAFFLLLLSTAGFTLLAQALRDEFNPRLQTRFLVFYTFSFIFSTYILTTGASWVSFLGNQSALPWLTLGILDRKILRGTSIIVLFTIHQVLCAFPAMTISSGIWLTLFAAGMTLGRRSAQPLFAWCTGNAIALCLLTPYLLPAVEGFSHTVRQGGLSLEVSTALNIPVGVFPSSFFLGNWSELIARWSGVEHPAGLTFPFVTTILACAAAWCVIPALIASRHWRYIEILCAGLTLLLVIMIIRPTAIELAMQHIPFLRSMRWPFRESLQFLFFVHLFLIVRPQKRFARIQPQLVLFSLAAFLLPLPFSHVPTFNLLPIDRQSLFSGEADAFWARVKTLLKPGDQIATVIDLTLWHKDTSGIPYDLLGTANFPAYFQVPCITGYSGTAPLDQVPLKTVPFYWFGAFRPEQVPELMAEQPNLQLIRIESTQPLKISLISPDGTVTDLSPYLHP